MRARSILTISLLLSFCTPILAAPKKPVEQIDRVLIISIDGLRPDLLLRGNTPNIHRLFEQGTYSFWARTTAAATTLPSHVSMLTGVTPEVHSIMWNGDLPLSKRVYSSAPTLFKLAKKAGYTTAAATGKSKFNVLDEPGTLDWKYFPEEPTTEDDEITTNAERILREHKPGVMFVHLAGVDNAGHAKGWGSPEQMLAIEMADKCLGVLLAALDELKLRQSTLILLSSDHGGAGRTHGPDDPRSRTIPWIVNGPGIRKNFDLTLIGDIDVETYDTFTTSCTMLGIPIERRVRGKFIPQILEQQELLNQPNPPTMQPTTQSSP